MARVITSGLLVVVVFDVSIHFIKNSGIFAYKLLQAVEPIQLDLVA